MSNARQLDRPTAYQIRVKGILDKKWSDWFSHLVISPQANGETLMTGLIADQAALHGLLNRIRDMGLPLLSVNRVQINQGHDCRLDRLSDQPEE